MPDLLWELIVFGIGAVLLYYAGEYWHLKHRGQ